MLILSLLAGVTGFFLVTRAKRALGYGLAALGLVGAVVACFVVDGSRTVKPPLGAAENPIPSLTDPKLAHRYQDAFHKAMAEARR